MVLSLMHLWSSPSITCTACLSDGRTLREAEGAWVHVVLLELTVAMVTAADVAGAMEATVLFFPACFSPVLCLSISQVTHRLSDGETVQIKERH